jgi:hypothetical protein
LIQFNCSVQSTRLRAASIVSLEGGRNVLDMTAVGSQTAYDSIISALMKIWNERLYRMSTGLGFVLAGV